MTSPVWETNEPSIDLPRNVALLDTNVLIAHAVPTDRYHNNTVAALDLGAFRWAVTRSTVIESWNFITGSLKRPDLAHSMMEWIMSPGEFILIGETTASIETARRYSRHFGVDIVDACLLDLASRISTTLMIEPAVHVATYDTGDFLRLFGQEELKFHLYDMRDLSSTSD